jgi:hypothetical protein
MRGKGRVLSKALSNGFTVFKKVEGVFERVMQAELAAAGGTGDSPARFLRQAHWHRQTLRRTQAAQVDLESCIARAWRDEARQVVYR